MKRLTKQVLCLVLTAITGSQIFAQDAGQREQEILNRNIQLYKTGMYDKAEQNFALMVSRLPDSRFITTNYLMLAKSQYKNSNYMASINTAKNFISTFPKSQYVDLTILI